MSGIALRFGMALPTGEIREPLYDIASLHARCRAVECATRRMQWGEVEAFSTPGLSFE